MLSEEEKKQRKKEADKRFRNTPIGRAFNLLSQYKKSDKKNNRGECTITPKWIVNNIFSKSCVYCGKTGWDVIGCNRIDNTKPHTENNVEPCCFECNAKLRGKDIIDEQSKQVYQYTIDGKFIKAWKSAVAVKKEFGFDNTSITRCCNGEYKSSNGYKWSYLPPNVN